MASVLGALTGGALAPAAAGVGDEAIAERPVPFPVVAVPALPVVYAHASVLMDAATGTVLYQQRAFERVAPASTTKIMTAVLALERGRLDDVVTVSRRAAYVGGSSMYLQPGQQYTLEELILGMMLRSGNDAATAIAEHIGGSVDAFVALMNRKAVEVGATDTHFANPHGLDNESHYTTAYDLAVLARYAMRNRKFAEIVALREEKVAPEGAGEEQTLRNINRLLWYYQFADGVKTGLTDAAGRCVVASATRDSQPLIAVVMRSGDLWNDAIRLLDWGYHNFRLARLLEAGERVTTSAVTGGRRPRVTLLTGEPLAVVVPRELADSVQVRMEVFGRLEAPLYLHQPVGAVYAEAGGSVLGQAPLVTARGVGRLTPLTILWDLVTLPYRLLVGEGD